MQQIREARDRAAKLAAVPAVIRDARNAAAGFEDSAVKAVLQYAGIAVAPVRAEARRRRSDRLLDFAALRQAEPLLRAEFTAGRLRFHYDGVIVDLLNDPAKTPMFSAWDDARRSCVDPVLVFRWGRVKRCRGWCVFHRQARNDLAPDAKWDSRFGFRLALPIAGSVFSIEPLPAFLHAIGWHQADDTAEDAVVADVDPWESSGDDDG